MRSASWTSRAVIRKPLSTKKISTPMIPPAARDGVMCKARTIRTARPRSPSSAGRWPSWKGTACEPVSSPGRVKILSMFAATLLPASVGGGQTLRSLIGRIGSRLQRKACAASVEGMGGSRQLLLSSAPADPDDFGMRQRQSRRFLSAGLSEIPWTSASHFVITACGDRGAGLRAKIGQPTETAAAW